MRPRGLWSDGGSALRDVCDGCPRETGWLEDPCEVDTPECAMLVADDRDVLTAHGFCAERIDMREREMRAEREVYERRMVGDRS